MKEEDKGLKDGSGREAVYLLEYEKQKMQEYAGSLNSLAAIFLRKCTAESEGDRRSLLWEKRREEDRQLFGSQLRQMAEVIERSASESVRIIRLGKRREKKIARMLLLEGLAADDLYLLEKEDGRRAVVITLSLRFPRAGKRICSDEEIAGYLSVLMKMNLVPCGKPPFFVGQTKQTMSFYEENRYCILSGFAKAVKEGEKTAGDNHGFFETMEGDFYAVLSDGMGSGEKACRDSRQIIEWIENFVTGGVSSATALRLINDALIMGGENKNMSTVDLCRINLHNATAEFIKVGAAATFLKHAEGVEEIQGSGLPLGIFTRPELFNVKRRIADGDYIFLFSDGITDCFAGAQGKDKLKKMLTDIPYRSPGQMANYIMEATIRISNGKIRDDCTVLVIGVWENEKGYDRIHT